MHAWKYWKLCVVTDKSGAHEGMEVDYRLTGRARVYRPIRYTSSATDWSVELPRGFFSQLGPLFVQIFRHCQNKS